jgi:hypothetical protein
MTGCKLQNVYEDAEPSFAEPTEIILDMGRPGQEEYVGSKS